MDISHLNYFVKIAEAGSISRAAQSLGVAQPGLSRFVRQLEEDLDCLLFERNGRGITMTDAGRRLYASAIDILGRVQNAHVKVAGESGPALGSVTLGISSMLATTWGPLIARSFRKKCPRLRLRISEACNSTLFKWIEHGQADVVIAFREEGVWSARQKIIAREDFSFIAHRSLLLNGVETFQKVPLVLPISPDVIRSGLENKFSERSFHPRIVCETDSISCMIELVGHAICAALVPTSLLSSFVQVGDISSVSASFTHDVVIGTPANRPLLTYAQHLCDCILGEAI